MENEATIYRQEVRDETALTAFVTCQTYGAVIEIWDRAHEEIPKVKVWSVPGPEIRELRNDGELYEEVTRKPFVIPRQYGCSCGCEDCEYIGTSSKHEEVIRFPFKNEPSINCQITFEGKEWSVETWEVDSLRAVYKCHAERHQARGTSKI